MKHIWKTNLLSQQVRKRLVSKCLNIIQAFLDDIGNMASMSNHPVHITSADAVTSFIPFCAFDGNLDSDGTQVGNLSFCNSFTPTIIAGQLCYALNMTKVGFIQEAIFFLDLNLERSFHREDSSGENSDLGTKSEKMILSFPHLMLVTKKKNKEKMRAKTMKRRST